MADLALFLEVEHVAIDMILGQHAQAQRRDELLRAFGENRAHGDTALAQLAHQFQRLIGRNAAGHDEKDTLGHALSLPFGNR